MQWPWSKKGYTAPAEVVAPVRELTGIEKWEIEQQHEASWQAAREREQFLAKAKARIAELEADIGPQMQELSTLRIQLSPYNHFAAMANLGMGAYASSMSQTPFPGQIIGGNWWSY